MTTGEKYRAEAQRLQAQARTHMEDADGLVVGVDDVPEDVQKRAQESYDTAKKLFERAEFYVARAKDADTRDVDQRTADAERGRNGWQERSQGGGMPRTSDLNEMPTVAQLQERSQHLSLRLRGESYDEDVANRTWPAEGLYAMVVRSKVPSMAGKGFSLDADQVKAWDEYVGIATRALTPTASTDVQGKGQELVPENMANRIFAAAKMYGGFADLMGISQFTQQSPGNFKVPTESDVEDWSPSRTAQGGDVTISEVDTGAVDIPLNNFAIQTVVTDQVLMSDNVSLEAFLVSRMGRVFGRRINALITSGTGTNQPKGVTTVANTRKTRLAANTAITAADVRNLLKSVDGNYHGNPTSRVHAHFNVLLDLAALRENGQRVFERSPTGLDIILDGGTPVIANNALAATAPGGSGKTDVNILVFADHMEYVVVRDGPMRFERARELRAFQWLLSWNMYLGGAPAVEEAFGVLTGR